MMDALFSRLMVALGVGLLIGAERERRKGEGPARRSAGIRSFAIAALVGAVSLSLGGVAALAAALLAVAALAGLAYGLRRDDDPGITTELALVLTTLLGALAMRDPAAAAAAAVAAAVLLALRIPLHRLVRRSLTEAELRDALVFSSATLIVLPLLPDRPMGPYAALNPRTLWIIVILMLGISAIGHVLVRALGVRFGLPLAGLASGFVSSLATVGAMGARAAGNPTLLRPAVAGATLSTLATVIQMTAVVAAQSAPTFRALAVPLGLAGLTVGVYGLGFLARAGPAALAGEEAQPDPGHAFSLGAALSFAAAIAAIAVLSAALQARLGEEGLLAAAAVGGLIDAHAAGVGVAALVASGRLAPADAVAPILLALSTNTASKIVAAQVSGGLRFSLRVAPGLVLFIMAAGHGQALQDLVWPR